MEQLILHTGLVGIIVIVAGVGIGYDLGQRLKARGVLILHVLELLQVPTLYALPPIGFMGGFVGTCFHRKLDDK